MPRCLSPRQMYCRVSPLSGEITWSPKKLGSSVPVKSVTTPCKKCIECRLEYSRQWAVRLTQEQALHDTSSFLTLTYDDENLPEGQTLVMDHVSEFLKNLRASLAYEEEKKVRFYACGEYGEKFQRPHYHMILFGEDFQKDRYEIERSDKDEQQWQSPSLTQLWGRGRAVIGTCTFESAAYVARYVTKKISGEGQHAHYGVRSPESARMSRRPGIGRDWFEKNKIDLINHDNIISRGRKMRPPQTYDRWLRDTAQLEYEKIKAAREEAALTRIQDPRPDWQLSPIRNKIARAKLKGNRS